MRGGLCRRARAAALGETEAPHAWGTVSRGSSANPTWLGKPRMRGGLWSDARQRGLARTVGVMEIENLFRYPALAVGVNE